RMATAEPTSAAAFMKRAKPSSTKAPFSIVPCWSWPTTATKATASTAIANALIIRVEPSPAKTPIMRSSNAPMPRISSGRTETRDGRSAAVIPGSLASWRDHRRGGTAGDRRLIIVDELVDRPRGHLHDRLGIDAEEDGERDERHQDDLLTQAEVQDS